MEKLKKILGFLLGYPASYLIGLILFSVRTFICLRHDFWSSFGLLFLVSLIASDIYICIYDKMREDLMGVEFIKETGQTEKGFLFQMIAMLNKKGKNLVTALLVIFEPVLVNLWSRKGHHIYDGDFYDAKAFTLMIVSILITSFYWTLFLKSMIHLVK